VICDNVQDGMKKERRKSRSIPGISRRAFLLLLRSLRTLLRLKWSNAIELYTAADLYHMDRLAICGVRIDVK
jgi:hypothetical protein